MQFFVWKIYKHFGSMNKNSLNNHFFKWFLRIVKNTRAYEERENN